MTVSPLLLVVVSIPKGDTGELPALPELPPFFLVISIRLLGIKNIEVVLGNFSGRA